PDAWGSPHRGARLDWDAPRGDASAPPAEPSHGLRHSRSAIARVEPRTRHARRGSFPPRAEGGAPRGGFEGRCAKAKGSGDRGAVSRGTADHAPRLCDPHAARIPTLAFSLDQSAGVEGSHSGFAWVRPAISVNVHRRRHRLLTTDNQGPPLK